MTKAEFINEFAEVLMEAPEKLEPTVELSTFETWDSTAAINLIVILEELGVTVDENKIRACTTVQDIIDLAGDKIA